MGSVVGIMHVGSLTSSKECSATDCIRSRNWNSGRFFIAKTRESISLNRINDPSLPDSTCSNEIEECVVEENFEYPLNSVSFFGLVHELTYSSKDFKNLYTKIIPLKPDVSCDPNPEQALEDFIQHQSFVDYEQSYYDEVDPDIGYTYVDYDFDCVSPL
mmetsp:Transcript_7850/g.23595  ORF Transcript_7850/g.23595 Transcript_7850/m.23595 type:complete len:159 (+) Transcript_7850:18-494(+)|eukprot:CAMPEP_0113690230 /NCGR_PEP_ID=MMETSP0038_2-20120614/17652_1 /TAXON_ID=2898 /ORGANISM="Cryptomonas paramecium" /LENGTH=158 /DNA_ID=CAMNT_0000611485 /DNA_START=29 /DNA_END=505 /DNA_ORIENTATION=- /assembly_acc=CAM_ASM_000170